MKLKPELVRSLLLYLEDNLGYSEPLYSGNITIDDYSKDDICYTIKLLKDGGYIKATNIPGDNYVEYLVDSITWKGHELLDNVRDSKVWREVKRILKTLASVSIPIIQSVASSVASSVAMSMIVTQSNSLL